MVLRRAVLFSTPALLHFQNLLSFLTLQWAALCLLALWTLEKNIFFSLPHWWHALVFPGFHLQFLAMGSAFGEFSPHFMSFPLSQGQVTSLQVTCCGRGCFPWPGLRPFKCFSVLTASQDVCCTGKRLVLWSLGSDIWMAHAFFWI